MCPPFHFHSPTWWSIAILQQASEPWAGISASSIAFACLLGVLGRNGILRFPPGRMRIRGATLGAAIIVCMVSVFVLDFVIEPAYNDAIATQSAQQRAAADASGCLTQLWTSAGAGAEQGQASIQQIAHLLFGAIVLLVLAYAWLLRRADRQRLAIGHSASPARSHVRSTSQMHD